MIGQYNFRPKLVYGDHRVMITVALKIQLRFCLSGPPGPRLLMYQEAITVLFFLVNVMRVLKNILRIVGSTENLPSRKAVFVY